MMMLTVPAEDKALTLFREESLPHILRNLTEQRGCNWCICHQDQAGGAFVLSVASFEHPKHAEQYKLAGHIHVACSYDRWVVFA